MTERTLTADRTGPVNFDATSNAADIHITVAGDRAGVTVSTTAATGPSHDAVRSATLTQSTGSLSAAVRDEAAMVVSTGRGSVSISGRNSGVVMTGSGSVVMSGGRVWVNGTEVTGAGDSGPLAPIVIRATLPAGSRIDVRTASGNVGAAGRLASATVRTTSGDITIAAADSANLTSVSGDIDLVDAGSVQASTTSGDVTVGTAGAVGVNSVSGDVRVGCVAGNASASTVSGDIRIGYSGPVRPSAGSVSGRVRLEPVDSRRPR